MKLDKTGLQLDSVVARIQSGDLDLQPDFQRGEIWDKKRRQRLVDTVLREWYVPAVHTVVDSKENEVVLDGQQRLAAIRDFFADKLEVDGSIEPRDDYIASLGGLTYSGLPPAVKRKINRFTLQMVVLSDYEPSEPNELFFRLNQSYNLTPSEKRNALHGEARQQVRDLVEELSVMGLLDRETVGFANGRLAYDDVVSRVCVAVEQNTLRRHINNTVVEAFYREERFSDSTISGIRRAGNMLRDLIGNTRDRVRFNKGTLQTWLIYCFWVPRLSDVPPVELLSSFESVKARMKEDQSPSSREEARLFDLLALYDDRSSYRVTDVSSVVLRDLVIHLFSNIAMGTEAYGGAERVAREIVNASERSVASLVTEFASEVGWGEPLHGRASL